MCGNLPWEPPTSWNTRSQLPRGFLDGACCSVEPDEAGGLIWLVPTKVFADLPLLVITLRLTERAARTRELHCWRVRANRSESSWQLAMGVRNLWEVPTDVL
jgi:hypothetical protein